MKMNRVTSVEKMKLSSSFESLCKTLGQEKYAGRINNRLEHWALPSDRSLPMALLDHKLAEILETSFAELSSTSGIGRKKINTLVKLLARATKDEPPAMPMSENKNTIGDLAIGENVAYSGNGSQFDPDVVSDALWSRWCDTIVQANLSHEKLGTISPSLQNLPTVIWNTPLSAYIGLTVREIYKKKTHGRKRVVAILEAFNEAKKMITDGKVRATNPPSLRIEFVRTLEDWVNRQITRPQPPSYEEVIQRLCQPLLAQIRIDLGEDVARLVEQRLGVDCEKQSVRNQSRNMGVTRARVYQLLDDCSKAIKARWPQGKTLMVSLKNKFNASAKDCKAKALFAEIYEILYPKKLDEIESKGQLAITLSGMNESA